MREAEAKRLTKEKGRRKDLSSFFLIFLPARVIQNFSIILPEFSLARKD
jgi:hypothetical protein